MEKVSVIIPTHNRVEDVLECLGGVFAQNYENMEVIVVDDGSTDGTAAEVKKKFPLARVLMLPGRSGVFGARNAGLKESTGAFVWFLDSDSLPEDANLVSRMVRIMDREPDCGSVGGESIVRGGERWVRRFHHLWFEDCWRENWYVKNGPIKECDYLPTCNCFYRKAIVPSLQAPPGNVKYGCEDNQIGLRINRAGFKNLIRPDTIVLHKRSDTSRVNTREEGFRAKADFLLKYKGIWWFFVWPAIEVLNLGRSALAARKISADDVKSDSGGGGFVSMGIRYVVTLLKVYFKTIVSMLTFSMERE